MAKHETFELRVSLPQLPESNCAADILSFWESVLPSPNALVDHFCKALEGLKEAGRIKRYKDVSSSIFFAPGLSAPPEKMGLMDFAKDSGFTRLAAIAFRVAIPHDGPIVPPSTETPLSFVHVNPPWRLEPRSCKIKHLKTQDNLIFGVWAGLDFPLIAEEELPNPHTCTHNFRLLEQGVWQWRLVWECVHCGFTCFCSCFEKAIEMCPPRNDELTYYGRPLGIKASELPFCDNACEVCRGVPSTNDFCHPMYARSLFERRYGAYVRKRIVEVIGTDSYSIDWPEINNIVRQELGFAPIGEGWVTETEVFNIVRSLLPSQEVIHHYRADWLDGQEIDILVPESKLAVEYNGEQHFKPIDAWGGATALRQTQERDRAKAKKCCANGIRLAIITFEDEITAKTIREAIAQVAPGVFDTAQSDPKE